MKKLLVLIGLIGYILSNNLLAQSVIWKDDFEDNKGWNEFEDETGRAIVKDGMLVIKARANWTYWSRCKTNLDVNKDFTIKGEISVKEKLDQTRYVGIVFNYYNRKNYSAFYIRNGFVYFSQVVNNQEVGYEFDVYKDPARARKGRGKDTKLFFEVKKKGQNVMLVINDEECLEIPIEGLFKSNLIALSVTGELEATFDNIEIRQ